MEKCGRNPRIRMVKPDTQYVGLDRLVELNAIYGLIITGLFSDNAVIRVGNFIVADAEWHYILRMFHLHGLHSVIVVRIEE